MTLVGQSKLFRHGKAATMYVTIPAGVVKDSSFTWKEGDYVAVRWDPENLSLQIVNHTKWRKKP